MTIKAKDHYGRSIRSGDVVTYPVRKGSQMWLATAKVDEVRTDGALSATKDNGSPVTIFNTQTTVLASDSVRRQTNRKIRAAA